MWEVQISANDQKEYEQALKDAYSYEDEVVIEADIKGREFSVAVVDGKAYPVIEIAPIQGFYDYKNKYQAGSTIETCPAELFTGAYWKNAALCRGRSEGSVYGGILPSGFHDEGKRGYVLSGSQYPAGDDTCPV